MADRGTWKGFQQYWIIVLILIIVVLIVYYLAGGPSTPGPQPQMDTTPAPVVEP